MRLTWHLPRLVQHGCGLSRRARTLAAGLAERHKLTLAVPMDATDVETDALDGVPVRRLPAPELTPPHWSLQAATRRTRAARLAAEIADDCDVLLTCQPEFAEAADRMRPHRPVVLVACCSQTLFDGLERRRQSELPLRHRPAFALNRRLLQRNERRGFRAARATAFDSWMTCEASALRYGLDQSRCFVVAPTVDAAEFQPAAPETRCALRGQLGMAPDDFVIAWTGRMAPGKNVGLLLEAAAMLPGTTRVALAGDGPEREAIRQCAARLRLGDRVRFLGMRSDVRPLLQAADAFVFPSQAESFGIALIEAMACGLPCIAVADRAGGYHCGATEAIVDGVTGYVLPFGDAAELAGRLARWIADPGLRCRMGRAGRERTITQYAAGRDARQLEQILESIVH